MSWVWTNIGVIACSALFVVSPFASSAPFRIAFGLLLAPVYFFLLIRQMRKSGAGDIPMSRLAAKVRAGRRLPVDALELAAAVALLLAIFHPFRN